MDELVFPAELFHQIFYIIQQENSHSEAITTLVACSTSCKSFSDLCRPFIFERIYIRTRPPSYIERAISFVQVIDQHPNYLNYIRDLVIDLHGNANVPLLKYMESNPEALTRLHSILVSFSRLRSITITSPASYSFDYLKIIASDLFKTYFRQETLRMAHITEATSEAANAILYSPSLHSLTLTSPSSASLRAMLASSTDLPTSSVKELKIINGHEFPLAFLQLFPLVTSLEIHGSYLLSTTPKGVYPRPYLMLEHLSLSIYQGMIWRQLVQFLKDATGTCPQNRFPRLEDLTLCVGSEDGAAESSAFLEDCYRLRKLRIDARFQMGMTYRSYYELMNVPQHIRHTFSSLEQLSLSLGGADGFEEFGVKLSDVHSLLVAIRGNNKIQRFHLTLNVYTRHYRRLSSDTWSDIGLILAEKEDFSYLVEVQIFVITLSHSWQYHQARTWEEDQFERSVEAAGRVLQGRDDLVVETSVKKKTY